MIKHLSDILLPYGSFIMKSTIFDSNGGSILTHLDSNCNVRVTSNKCNSDQISNLDLTYMFGELIENELSLSLLSTKTRWLYVLQSMQGTLEYLVDLLENSNNNCTKNETRQMLTAVENSAMDAATMIYNHFGLETTSLCKSVYTVVSDFVDLIM